MCKRQAGVDDGVAEREALTLVYGDGPCCLDGVLAEQSLAHLFYLFRCLVEFVAVVLPLFLAYLYEFVAVFRTHAETFGADCRNATYHAVVVAFLWRRVVFHEHHLRVFLQFQHLVGGKRQLWELALHLCAERERLARELVKLGAVYLLRHDVVGGESYVALFLTWLEVWHIAAVELTQHLGVGMVVAHAVEKFHKLAVALSVDMRKLYDGVVGLAQRAAAEEVWCFVIAREQSPFLVFCNRGELSEVADEQQLHAAKGSVVAAVVA